ncbi:hypothetical protein C0W44_06380 [Photobacterium leiognathi subsp. mandapamensis]|nr:hypothetical protein C0W44_06380 [Photobacterium leiognathi subsp. mandapamensis]
MKSNQQVNSIQVLRGICAILVVWVHSYNWVDDVYPSMGRNLFSFGFIGVDIFFIISGFVITYVTVSKKEQNVSVFLIKRFFRVVPLAWLAIITYGFVSGYSIKDLLHDPSFIKSLFFIPIDSAAQAPAYGYGFLIVTWTLTYELIFYVLFSISMGINKKYRSLICSFMIVILMFSLQYISSGFLTLNTHKELTLPDISVFKSIYGVISNPMMLYFIAGMILAEIYIRLPNRNLSAVSGISILIIILCLSYLMMVNIPYNRLITVGPWCVLIVAAMLLWERLGKFEAPDFLISLGTLTYSLYLFHVPIQEYFYSRRIPSLDFFYAGFSGFSKMMFFTSFSLLISILVFIIFEKSFSRLGRIAVGKIYKKV